MPIAVNRSRETLPERRLFAIDAEVDARDQRAIIAAVRTRGKPLRGLHAPADLRPYWLTLGLTAPDPDGLPDTGRRWLAGQAAGGPTLARWGYYARLDPSVRWRWHDGPVAATVQRLLAPVRGLFRQVTKVNVVLQVPGEPLGAHRDLVHGNLYDLASPFHWRPGPTRQRYEGEPWLHHVGPIHNASHADNLYLCLKIPLSERDDDCGRPFVQHEGTRVRYTSRNRLFFLNECEQLHGAEPVAFWRGVAFVNGLLDVAAVHACAKHAVEVVDTRTLEPG